MERTKKYCVEKCRPDIERLIQHVLFYLIFYVKSSDVNIKSGRTADTRKVKMPMGYRDLLGKKVVG